MVARWPKSEKATPGTKLLLKMNFNAVRFINVHGPQRFA